MKRTLILAAAATAAVLVPSLRRAEAKLDAVSAASLSVRVPTVTATTAVIEYYRDKYDYGTRTLCYDPAPAAPRNNCTTKTASGNSGSFTVSGLKPGTAYNFQIEAIDTKDHERPYATSGSFTTEAVVSLHPSAAGPGAAPAPERFDALGRAVPDGKTPVGRTPLRPAAAKAP